MDIFNPDSWVTATDLSLPAWNLILYFFAVGKYIFLNGSGSQTLSLKKKERETRAELKTYNLQLIYN